MFCCYLPVIDNEEVSGGWRSSQTTQLAGIPSRNSHSTVEVQCPLIFPRGRHGSSSKLGGRTFSCRLVRFPFQIRRNRQRSALASLRLVRYLARGRSRNRRSSSWHFLIAFSNLPNSFQHCCAAWQHCVLGCLSCLRSLS